MKNFMDARIPELIAMGATFAEASAHAQAEWNLMNKKSRQGTGKPAAEKHEYVKQNGETILATQKQIDNWNERKGKLEELKVEWEAQRAAYEPSEELIAAIKADRSKITREIAKAKYGFVGNKKDLAALKDRVCAK